MIWIRLDTDNAEILGADEHPAHGEWIEWGEARRIIREHSEREAENAERDAAHKADADLAASLHMENAGLRAVVERNVTSVLVDHARGVLPHRYEGACPDSVEGPDVRDPECPVCRAIDSVSRLRPIGPGEVVVREKELNVLLILERYARKHGPESIDYAIEALDALRAQKGGGAT